MSDIFREVDEDVRRDQLFQLWRRYGSWALGGLGAALIIVGSWSWWRSHVEAQRMADSEAFTKAVEVAASGDTESALTAFQSTLPQLDGGYELLARLRTAAKLTEADRIGEAVSVYDAIAADSAVPSRLRNFAQIQAAMALMGQGNDEDVFARLDPLAVPGRPYYHLAQELRGYLLWKQDRDREAYEVFDGLANDPAGPPGVRQRASQLRQLLDSSVLFTPADETAGDGSGSPDTAEAGSREAPAGDTADRTEDQGGDHQ